MHKAVKQLTCVFVDHGLLRKGEAEQVKHDFVKATGIKLIAVDASEDFLTALKGVSEPEEQDHQQVHSHVREGSAPGHRRGGCFPGKEVKFLVVSGHSLAGSRGIRRRRRRSQHLVVHHNVGGLPDDIKFQLVDHCVPCSRMRLVQMSSVLGLPDEVVSRQPFPGPGLGIRVIGEITKERLDLLSEADAIAREELSKAGLDRDIWQCPVVLLADVHSVGVPGDWRPCWFADRVQ